jgi:hypothetical protein
VGLVGIGLPASWLGLSISTFGPKAAYGHRPPIEQGVKVDVGVDVAGAVGTA